MKFDFDFLLDFCVVNSLGFLEGVKMPKNDSRVLISKFYYKSRGVFYNKILILWYFYFVLPPFEIANPRARARTRELRVIPSSINRVPHPSKFQLKLFYFGGF